jgi:hypothetical protein
MSEDRRFEYAYRYAARCAAGRGEQWSPPPRPVPPSPPSPEEVMERYRRWCE